MNLKLTQASEATAAGSNSVIKSQFKAKQLYIKISSVAVHWCMLRLHNNISISSTILVLIHVLLAIVNSQIRWWLLHFNVAIVNRNEFLHENQSMVARGCFGISALLSVVSFSVSITTLHLTMVKSIGSFFWKQWFWACNDNTDVRQKRGNWWSQRFKTLQTQWDKNRNVLKWGSGKNFLTLNVRRPS